MKELEEKPETAETTPHDAPEGDAGEPERAEAAAGEPAAADAGAPPSEPPAEGEASAAPPPPTNPNMRWYIIHTYSGFERKVRESLESRVEAFGLKEKIGRVVIPTETVTTVRGGKKYTSEQMFYPGYVLVEMDLTGFGSGGEGDNVWHLVKATPRVTGFLGGGQHPTPLSEEEVNQIIYRVST